MNTMNYMLHKIEIFYIYEMSVLEMRLGIRFFFTLEHIWDMDSHGLDIFEELFSIWTLLVLKMYCYQVIEEKK